MTGEGRASLGHPAMGLGTHGKEGGDDEFRLAPVVVILCRSNSCSNVMEEEEE